MQKIEKIVFNTNALVVIESEVKTFGIIETGGVLMGYIENKIIYVEKISNGGPNAIHEDIYFRADSNYIDMFIDMEYANSKGEIRYLGEWHTHPQVEPEPSKKDITSLFEIAESSDDFCLLLIIGAVNYDHSKFLNQHVAIIKHKSDKKGCCLPVSIDKSFRN